MQQFTNSKLIVRTIDGEYVEGFVDSIQHPLDTDVFTVNLVKYKRCDKCGQPLTKGHKDAEIR